MRELKYKKRLLIITKDIINGYRLTVNDYFKPYWRKVILAVMTTVLLFGGGMGILHNQYQGLSRKVSAAGTTYYIDATNGSDSYNGLTTSTAWKTINKVNNAHFSPGDTILFKRGEIWRERLGLDTPFGNGSAGSPITIDAYGTGAKPVFSGALDLSDAALWQQDSGNVWRTTATLANQIGNLRFNNSSTIGWKKLAPAITGTAATGGASTITLDSNAVNLDDAYKFDSITITAGTGAGQQRSISDYTGSTKLLTVSSAWNTVPDATSQYSINVLLAQGDFQQDAGGYLYMYSSSNPGSFYTAIDAAQRMSPGIGGPYIYARDYVTLRNIHFTDSGLHGLVIAGTVATPSSHIIVEYCDWTYSGGSYDMGNRDGNGIMFWATVTDIIVRFNTFKNIWMTGISYQTQTTSTPARIEIYGNIIEKSSCGLDIWNNNANAPIDDYYIHNNIVYDTGQSVFQAQWTIAAQPLDIIVYGGSGYGALHSSKIQHNIFYGAVNTFINAQNGVSLSELNIDYNCYYPVAGANFNYQGGKIFSAWKTATGWDSHSVTGDPNFVTLGSDWHLQSGSSCAAINTGLYISGDANNDYHVTITDLSILAAHWGSSGMTQNQGDFNNDGQVNISDLSILAAHWGT